MPPFVFDPPPGIVTDDTPFSSKGRWADGDGFRFYLGKAESIGGYDLAAATVFTTPNKMLAYSLSGTAIVAIAGTLLSRCGVSDAGSSTSTNITPASGWDANSRHCLQLWGDDLLASCSGGKLFTSSAGAQATEITQSPDAITCMIVTPSRQVMALGCNEESGGVFNGRCIRFSDIEDNTDWTTSPTNNAGEYILPGQANIVSGCVLGDYVLIWTQSALWLGQFIGDPAQPWSFTRVADVGICGLDAFAIAHDTVYWVSPGKRFHFYQVGGAVSEILCPVSNFFTPDITALSHVFAYANRKHNEIWFCFTDTVSSSAATKYISYAINESAAGPVWFKGTLSTLRGSGGASTGAIIDDPILLPRSGTNATSVLAIAYDAGVAGLWWIDGSVSLTGCTLQSADQYFDEGERRVMIRRFTPDFEYQTGTLPLQIFTRNRPRDTDGDDVQLSVTTSATKTDFRLSGRIFYLLFGSTAGRLRLGRPTFDIVPLGER